METRTWNGHAWVNNDDPNDLISDPNWGAGPSEGADTPDEPDRLAQFESKAVAPIKSFWQKLTDVGMLKQLPGALKEQFIDPNLRQFGKAKDDFSQGHYSEAAGHALAGALPFVGPQAAEAGEAIGRGEYGTGAAQSALALGGVIGPSLIGKALGPLMAPVEDTAASAFTRLPDEAISKWGRASSPFEREVTRLKGEYDALDPNPPPPRSASEIFARNLPRDLTGTDSGTAGTAAGADAGTDTGTDAGTWNLHDLEASPRSPTEILMRNLPQTSRRALGVTGAAPADVASPSAADWDLGGWGPSRRNSVLGEPDQGALGLGPDASIEYVTDDSGPSLNGSGESAASHEAINRTRAMGEQGQQFAVYDRAGVKRPLPGVDAVDYTAQPGETYGIDGPEGFQTLDDRGGVTPDSGIAKARGALQQMHEGAPNPVIDRVQALYDQLQPEWAAARARTADVPFDIPDETFPEFYQRVLTDPERELMGSERTVRRAITRPPEAAAPAIPPDDPGGEAGFIDPAAAKIAAQRIRDTAGEGLAQHRLANMLGPTAVVKKALGDVGAVLARSGEEAIGGNPGRAGSLLKSFFSPQTVRDMISEYRQPVTAADPTTFGRLKGVTGAGGRIMNALTKGTEKAFGRAGYTPDEAQAAVYTNVPKAKVNADVLGTVQRNPIARLVMPFPKVLMNIAERNIEHIPVVGPMAQFLSRGRLQSSIPKQILGGAAGIAGYKYGDKVNPYLRALLGPVSIPFSMGAAGASATGDPEKAMYDKLIEDTPLPSSENPYNPGNWLAQTVVPWPVDLAARLTDRPPSAVDTSHHPFIGPTLARIPFLNRLLPGKRKAAHAAHAPHAR